MAGKEEERSAAEEKKAEIKWNEETQRFETEDKEAYLQYHLLQIADGKTTMDMVHTFVPRSKRGMGLAAKLCDAAFDHARSRDLAVIATCSYISDTYIPKNPAWNSLVYKDEPKSSM
ncbi:Acyl-CoA N-acyltransferases (NAT) superfamily protein [Rhynchospora pubera]|uniref:Acyl-CoA N-acyltransferases (NAT) superfamily protein n=1 Tax=Rhynchospora pubera TaxID=906938 RepID=A0AAV8CLJ9_9POAL|nr:Acyl-CoA N-acyltransferases (NAT) superfamily protein [Rhynchospora pubera]